MRKSWMGCVLSFCAVVSAAHGVEQCMTCQPPEPAVFNLKVLPKDAKCSAEVKLTKNQELNWVNNGEAAWNITVAEPVQGAYIVLDCMTSPRTLATQVTVDGKETTFRLFSTTGKKNGVVGSIGQVDLPAGSYAFKLRSEKGSHLLLRSLTLTARQPRDPFAGVPSFFEKKKSWAESMVASRARFNQPDIRDEFAAFGDDLDELMCEKDGRVMWEFFPKETDWLMQDNINYIGFEKYKGFDARGDFYTYFQPDRSSEFEQQLIQPVLQELGIVAAKPFQNRFNVLLKQQIPPSSPAWLQLYADACSARRLVRIQPLLAKTDQVIYATHHNMGQSYLISETQGCPDGSELRIIDLTPLKKGRPLIDELLFDSKNGIVRDPELSFDAKKMLFAWRKTNEHINTTAAMAPETGNYKIYEMDLATKKMRQLTFDDTYSADFEPCYMPSGDIMFSSARCVQEITCGFSDASNLYLMNKDGKYARRIGFDQTQTGFPHLLEDGRVIYARRDYNDRGQSFGHGLFVMNSDGTRQEELYGNNSFYPTSYQHCRPIPGTSTILGIGGGYHSTQGGKLMKITPKNGYQYYEGIEFQEEDAAKNEGRGENYLRWGPQFTYPYPIDDNHFLVSGNPVGTYLKNPQGTYQKELETELMHYNLYFMNWDGRRELLAAHPTLSSAQGTPVMPRKRPSVRATSVDYTKNTGTCYVQNVYYGQSSKGIPHGDVKKIRVVKLFYKPVSIGAAGFKAPGLCAPGEKYGGHGWHSVLPCGVGSASFEAKEVIGEAIVHEDGSAMFEVPARVPFYFQLIDKNGLTLQTMRSWATLMPNENFSCVGCHELKNSSPLAQQQTMALQRPPQKLQPAYSVSGKPFSYAKMVQPILNKHCVSCHSVEKKAAKYDLSDTLVIDNLKEKQLNSTRHKFYQSYLTLLGVGRRSDGCLDAGFPNENVDYYTRLATVELTPPYYAGSVKSGLINKLLAGHGKTNISADEIGIIACWIDLNVPFIGEYDELNTWDKKAHDIWTVKTGMRHKMEAVDSANIKQYVKDGQP